MPNLSSEQLNALGALAPEILEALKEAEAALDSLANQLTRLKGLAGADDEGPDQALADGEDAAAAVQGAWRKLSPLLEKRART